MACKNKTKPKKPRQTHKYFFLFLVYAPLTCLRRKIHENRLKKRIQHEDNTFLAEKQTINLEINGKKSENMQISKEINNNVKQNQ